MKALVGAFNQEKALVGAFSVIVKTGCGTDRSLSECATNIGIIATISPVIVTQMSTRPNNGPAISDANCPTFVLINKHFEPVLLVCYEYIFESIARNIYILYTRIRGQQKQAYFSRACG